MGSSSSTSLPMSEIDVETYQGIRYSQEVPNTKEPSRGAIYVTKPVYVERQKLTLYENFLQGLAIEDGTRPCYGTRVIHNGQAQDYAWITYSQVHARAEAIASGLKKLTALPRQEPIGIFSKNRVEWCLVSHAADRMAYTLVPLYDTLGPDAVPYIVNHTELTTLFCAIDQFSILLESQKSCPSLKYIIQYEPITPEQQNKARERGLTLLSLPDLEALGKQNPVAPDPPQPDDIATLCYTSGTTGNPKGVMLLHRNMAVLGYLVEDRIQLTPEDVHISYLPLPHVFERAVMNSLIRLGASMGFYQGDVLYLLDDIAVLKPTLFVSVPRLFNRVYDKITQGVALAGGLKKILFDQAYASKRAGLVDGYKTHAVWDTLVFAKVRQVLGGRVRMMVSGSAPLSAEVKEFLKIAFSCDVVEGYGLSETSAGLTIASPDMPLGPHVGTPLANVQVRLEDVPEMGYTSRDKPRPRGEIIVKGDSIFAGYYKEPDKTAEAIDADGWFHTGDIGCWNADGTLSIIDRKKNIFKLSQGEYVAAEKIEGIYQKSKYVAQIFVYGDSLQSVLVGIVVPDPEVAEAWGTSKGRSKADSTAAKLISDREFIQEVLEDMERVAKVADLRGFEYVRKVHFHPEAFSVDQGLITPTFKLKRPQLKEFFKTDIDRMYAEMNS